MTVYPNPAVNTLNVKLQQNISIASISMINTLGQKISVLYTQHKENAQINLSTLQPGIYVVCIKDQLNQTYQTPIIIER